MLNRDEAVKVIIKNKFERLFTGVGGAKMMMFEDMHWHFECFKCSACDLQLEGQGFILGEESVIFCTECESSNE